MDKIILQEVHFMNVTRFINGEPISEKNFKSISIKSENTEKIILEAAKRAKEKESKNV